MAESMPAQRLESLVFQTAQRIRRILPLPQIFQAAVDDLRQVIQCDRCVIYQFQTDGSGVICAESVADPWMPLRDRLITDSCFKNGWAERYLSGEITNIPNIQRSHLSDCHKELLQEFDVQANLVIPIILEYPPASLLEQFHVDGLEILPDSASRSEQCLWGLLILHSCATPRNWHSTEIEVLQALVVQLEIVIIKSAMYQKLRGQIVELETVNQCLQSTQQQIQSLNQSLMESNQDLEQFAYVASHDLREPLRKINSFAELLAKRYGEQLDATGHRYLHYITDGAVRMQALIGDLLAYSRLGRQELACTEVNLNLIYQRVYQSLALRIAETNAQIVVDDLPCVGGDPLQLEQVFQNLLDNALKYYDRSSPKIYISALAQGEYWQISVQDNGIGIGPEYHDRIFAIFQRLHTRETYSGTGIGLAICKRIIERHGGQIGLASIPGEGSRFWFTLPRSV